MHNYFNVKEKGNNFYNKANQTPFGFDTTGSKVLKNRPLSEVHKKNISKSKKGKTYFSSEHKRKLSEAKMGNIPSIETRGKIGKAHKGKINSVETRGKISESRSGKYKGVSHHEAIIVDIYDNHDQVMFTTYGNFDETCKIFGLPLTSLKRSYQNNGIKIYMNLVYSSTISRLKNKGHYKYKGWYAMRLSKTN